MRENVIINIMIHGEYKEKNLTVFIIQVIYQVQNLIVLLQMDKEIQVDTLVLPHGVQKNLATT